MTAMSNPTLLIALRELLQSSRRVMQQSVNSTMVLTYWQVGQLIVEDEQQGEKRAIYGKQILKVLATTLSTEFGKGFDLTNLRKMRQFYIVFPIRDAVRIELSWTHYRTLIRIESDTARNWYLNESIEQG